MENSTKGRYWTFLIFEDNIEKNPRWLEKLIDTHLRFVISPYHDHDVWTEEDKVKHPDREFEVGSPKKAHYHVMIHGDDNMTYKSVKDLCINLSLPLPWRISLFSYLEISIT